MASSGSAQAEMTVKLLGSVSTGRVVYIEAEKDFVDVLLTLLALPVGSLLHILRTTSETGSVSDTRDSQFLPSIVNVYSSIADIDQVAFEAPKTDLMEPSLPAIGNHKLLTDYVGSQRPQCYRCGSPQYACPYISTSSTFVCPSHSTSGKRLLCEVVGCTGNVSATPLYYCSASASCKYISPQQSFRCPEHSGSSKAVAVEVGAAVTGTSGFVKESFTFMITDDLQIFRLSTIRSIQLLNEMKITYMGDLSGVQVNVGKEEILKLIRLAITSQTGVLTAVFSKQFSEHLKKRESHKETK